MSLILPTGYPRKGPLPRVEIGPRPQDVHGTYGPEAIELAEGAGLVADDWQQDGVNLLLSYRKNGKWACRNYCEWVPRQNGKGPIGYIRVLFGLFVLKEELLVWSAHEGKTAMEAMRRIEGYITNHDDFRKQVKRIVHHAMGPTIETLSGQRLMFFARTAGGGRGFSGDFNMIDESFDYTFDNQAAAKPTLSARPNPQTVYTSTPPLDGESSNGEVMWQLRDQAEPWNEKESRRVVVTVPPKLLGYRDWGIGDVDVEREAKLARLRPSMSLADNRQAWEDTNPAFGIRIDDEAIEDERTSMGLWHFLRERLGAWPARAGQGELPAIEAEKWRAIVDEGSKRDPDADVELFVDVTPRGDHGVIGLWSVRADGLGHGVIASYDEGIEWIPERARDLARQLRILGIGIDLGGTADKLLREKLLDPARGGFTLPEDPEKPERGQLCLHDTGDVVAGVTEMLMAISGGTWRTTGQPQLDLAAENAGLRVVGDGFAWARRVRTNREGKILPTVDISPMIAVTGAKRTYAMWIDKVRDTYDPLQNIW
jgi:hypothetical protein